MIERNKSKRKLKAWEVTQDTNSKTVQPTRSNTSTTTRMVRHRLHYDNDLYAWDTKKNKIQ